MYNPEAGKKIQKMCFVFQKIAFELADSDSESLEYDTCDRMSMC